MTTLPWSKRWGTPLCLTMLLPLGGCLDTLAVRSADAEVGSLLTKRTKHVLDGREAGLVQPVEAPAAPPEPGASIAEAESDEAPLAIDLAGALAMAFESSTSFLDRRESLYLEGLGFTLTRHNFGPILDGTISYVWSKTKDEMPADRQSVNIGARQILPTGGTVSVSSSLSGTRENDPNILEPDGAFSYTPSLGFSISQPLLRGAGYELSHESLTQGEQSLVYSIRSFELFRQDFALQVAQAFYDLVSQEARLANDRQNRNDAVFDREKAEALRLVDRNKDDDVFLARRREIDAEDALLVAETAQELAMDDFKILLGLPTSTKIVIEGEAPPFVPVRFTAASAVRAALANRLDLSTERDRLEDVDRQVRLAKNNLLPALDLTTSVDYSGDTSSLSDVSINTWSASVGVTLELPLDRKAERNSYRSALMGRDRARRDFNQRLAEVERDILGQLRELGQIEKRIQLQTEQILREQRAVTVTKIRYESGDVDNRDLLDARQGLNNAQNALIDLQVRHFMARLQLYRDMGILVVDNQGMWQL